MSFEETAPPNQPLDQGKGTRGMILLKIKTFGEEKDYSNKSEWPKTDSNWISGPSKQTSRKDRRVGRMVIVMEDWENLTALVVPCKDLVCDNIQSGTIVD